ncbi:hypothetical protein [Shinella oryzae]|uniref:Lipoprotein n=1 Tax=Shinella oryzae TaxID=2871820 RepID=A0ABY9K909_9HYPH|nr:hypothetical protein [Shinella oryzae]WLS04455.1 hypothetical protein Q9315_07570 [Shinella oryzae]
MGMTRNIRVRTGLFGLLGGSLLLTGCMGPTYGTDKTAGEQLIDDLGNAVMIQPENKDAKKVRYQPRGGLVVPRDKTALANPQQSVASKDNPEWLENPEDMRERLRAEADENANDPRYRSPLAGQNTTARQMSTAEQTQAYREARRLQMGAYSDQRRYLSDPPTEYRRIPEEAQADLGEPEKQKERRRKKEARAAKQGGSSWWPF